ncbi:chorismate mutase [candidate division KSB1 bacterium]|nr:chorismate mutase [candidate division KSB1 bacterium]
MNISSLRRKIDEIDRKILALLCERASVALEIGRTKRDNNLSIIHPERENEILEGLIAANNGPLSDNHIRKIYHQIISACRNIQN